MAKPSNKSFISATMTFRLLHTSDWHLGQHFYGKSRAKEHSAFLSWLLEQVDALALDAIVVAGDIFDTSTPPSYARELYFNFISELSHSDCKLIIVAGNHDSAAMLSESQQLLKQVDCTVIATPTNDIEQQIVVVQSAKTKSKVAFGVIPYLRPQDITRSEAKQSAKDKQGNLQKAIADHYQDIFALAKSQVDENTAVVLTGHLTTVGVTKTDSVRDIYIGTLEAFPASAFPDADYIALGHIHQNQIIARKQHIRYSGSPIPLSFDEAKQIKKVNLVTFDEGHLSDVSPINVPCFQPLLMIKTNIDSVNNDVELAIKQWFNENTDVYKERFDAQFWLDIELDTGDYIEAITPLIKRLTEDFPVDVLLVRRAKKERARILEQVNTRTLSELTAEDVFSARLALESWDTEALQSREARLKVLFEKTLQQVQSETEGEG